MFSDFTDDCAVVAFVSFARNDVARDALGSGVPISFAGTSDPPSPCARRPKIPPRFVAFRRPAFPATPVHRVHTCDRRGGGRSGGCACSPSARTSGTYPSRRIRPGVCIADTGREWRGRFGEQAPGFGTARGEGFPACREVCSGRPVRPVGSGTCMGHRRCMRIDVSERASTGAPVVARLAAALRRVRIPG